MIPIQVNMTVEETSRQINMGIGETSQSYNMESAEAFVCTADKTYVHVQAVASDRWQIQHNLSKYPSVTIVDSANTEVIGGVQYIDENVVVCTFEGAFSGKAFLN